MAVNETSTGQNRAGRVVLRLMALGCPYLQGMDDSVVEKVLLTPGEARLRVLRWLVERFRGAFQEQLETAAPVGTRNALTVLLADMGLCSRENYALVEVHCHTSRQQQLLFLEALLDMIEMSAMEGSVSSQLESSCRFADTLCCAEDIERVFPRFLNLMPPDVSGGGNSDTKETRYPSLTELKREAERLTTLAEEKTRRLDSITQQHQYQEINNPALQSCLKTLAVSLGTLSQLVVNFCHSYETELQPWVGHRPAPQLGPLGPMCKRTIGHWQHISKVLHSLKQLEATLDRLTSLRCMPVGPESADLYPSCYKAQETLQQCIDVVGDLMPT